MPSVLNDHDKETVKRLVPKASNKIQAVAVAKLYVVHPRSQRWTYTGLQGAAVLSNDLVGNTFWIKLVDISPANQGVIWDQEIYDTFQYNQDRTFFHSFELESCMAGLSFVDEKEARQFMKKMMDREKNASKQTKATMFGSGASGGQLAPVPQINGDHNHHEAGGRLGRLFGRRHASNPAQAPQAVQPQSAPTPIYSSVPSGLGGSRPQSSAGEIDLSDPAYRPILDELVAMGITEDQIEQNRDFIISYIKQKQAEDMANGIANVLPSSNNRHAPPPPPSAGLAPQDSYNRRGPAPAPPPSRKPVSSNGRSSPPPREPSPSSARTPSPPASSGPRFQFRAPPPLAEAGKFATKESSVPESPSRARANSNLINPGPPPPPRPPKELDEEEEDQVHRAPPPFSGGGSKTGPPPPPSRGPVPAPPTSRNAVGPPPPPSRSNAAPVPPPLPPANTRTAVPPPPVSNSLPPPPPPMPASSSSGGPPPPPLPPSSNIPAPPSLPNLASTGGGRDDLMAAIRGNTGLRKVRESDKRDRSAAMVPGTEGSAPPPPGGAPPTPGAGDSAGLAGALQAALSKRKQKVGGSDDERDSDDEW